MEAKIFVIAFPTFETVAEKIGSVLDNVLNQANNTKKYEPKSYEDDLTPARFKNHSFEPQAPIPQWGIGGKKADENLRFGAEFAIDEPRRSNYDNFDDFEYDHMLYDEFVTCGEECVNRGLAKPEGVTTHRCNAIRKKLNEAPPMRDELPSELIGETDWFSEEVDWPF